LTFVIHVGNTILASPTKKKTEIPRVLTFQTRAECYGANLKYFILVLCSHTIAKSLIHVFCFLRVSSINTIAKNNLIK
jgi:hypothetical protein